MSGGNTSGTVTLPGGQQLVVPQQGAGKNIGGLADGAKFTVDVHNLPVALTSILVNAGITDLTNAPADLVRQALATIPENTQVGRNAIATLQQMLWFSNQYDPSKVTSLSAVTLGKLGPNDLTAIKNVLNTAGQTQQPLGDYLVTSANIGKANGIINGYTGKPQAMDMPAPLDEDAALRSAAASVLQRDPRPDEMARFRAFYDQLTVDANKKAAIANELAAQQGNQAQAAALGDALNTTGQGFGDKPEAPNQFQQNPMAEDYPRGPSGVSNWPGTQPVPGPQDYARGPSGITDQSVYNQEQHGLNSYYQSQNDANNTAASALASAKAGAPTAGQLQVQHAPSLTAAANEFLQQRYGPEIAQNTVLGKYAQIIASMRGT